MTLTANLDIDELERLQWNTEATETPRSTLQACSFLSFS